MKKIKKFTFFMLIIVIITSFAGISVQGYNNVAYSTYSYNYEGQAIKSPHAYLPSNVFSASDFGLAPFSAPEDMCTDKAGNIYVADTGNARLVKITQDFSKAMEIKSFTYDGKEQLFNRPGGLYVTDDGEIYVADSGSLNIYVFSPELQCIRIITPPKSSLLPKDFSYIPSKVTVDKAGRIYIVSTGNTYGVVALKSDGEYSTFVGAQKVSVSVVDKLWRRFMTDEQKKRTLNYVPTNYNNINIDEKGFLYVTSTYSDINSVVRSIQTRSTENRYSMIKKLNSSGEDVLVRGGFFPPCGDVEIELSTDGNATNTDIYYGPSSIADVAIGKDGIYSLMDQKRGKIFTYDSSGNLLYAFGGTGQQSGLFRKLTAIDYVNDNSIIALDGTAGSITVFSPTRYGSLIGEAIHLSSTRKYSESVQVYEKILLENGNFDLANIGIGAAKIRQGDYEEAMYYYKLANDVDNYSVAYSNLRKESLGKFILIIPIAVIIICFLISRFFAFAKKYNAKTPVSASRKRSFLQEIMYGFHIIFRPFDGFWELKRQKRGSIRSANTILAVVIFSMLFREVGTGYIYTGKVTSDFNLFSSLGVLLGMVAIWCISNWCLTSLMYGEGNIKDIYIASCYALLPITFFTIPATLLSNFVTQNEIMFINALFVIGYIWTAILLFAAVLSTHNYEAGTNVIAIIFTIVGMIIIVFLMILFVNLIGQMYSMLRNIYNEITFRM